MVLMCFITNYCNLDCLNCSFHCDEQKEQKFFISLNEIEQIISTIKKNNISFDLIDLSGGEAFLHPQIFNILKIFRENFPNTAIQVYSNGLLISNFSLKKLLLLNQLNIQLEISIYPRKKYFNQYKKLIPILNKLNIKYNFQNNHYLFNHFNIINKNQPINKTQAIQCLKNNQKEVQYLKNNKVYPCCIALYHVSINQNQYQDSLYIFNENNKKFKTDSPLTICQTCQQILPYQHPWHSSKELINYIEDIKKLSPFMLYVNNYEAYYNLYFSQDEELNEIICDPLAHIALVNDSSLWEKHYINNKFISGLLDIFIYYEDIKDIQKIIKIISHQTILSKCNLYFIKNNNIEISESDKILYETFFPFVSLNYNSYFLKANNYEEAKKLFLKHSFLKNKIYFNLNEDIFKLEDPAYLENKIIKFQYGGINGEY